MCVYEREKGGERERERERQKREKKEENEKDHSQFLNVRRNERQLAYSISSSHTFNVGTSFSHFVETDFTRETTNKQKKKDGEEHGCFGFS